jgi:hypothetical protein
MLETRGLVTATLNQRFELAAAVGAKLATSFDELLKALPPLRSVTRI